MSFGTLGQGLKLVKNGTCKSKGLFNKETFSKSQM